MSTPEGEVSQLLVAWGNGDQGAFEQLVPVVHRELRNLARHYLNRESPGPPLQPTALVNEAFLKLVGGNTVRWENRAHFYGIAAKLMRER